MEGDNENTRFECAFSEKAIRNNGLSMMIYTISIILILCFVILNSDKTALNIWMSLALIVFVVLMDAISFFYVKRLSNGSYLEIATDSMLRCVFKGRKEVIYPINEIRSIEESSLKDARKRHASVPITLNSKGEELYPPEGVLITFNRAWIKSVFPVYFNPEDIPGFISAIRKRIKPGEEERKFEGKD